MLFYNSSCPSGWSNDNNQNNHALRTASSGGSKSGSANFSSVFGSSKNTSGHSLTASQMPSHFHYSFRSGNFAELRDNSSLSGNNYPGSGTGARDLYESYNINHSNATANVGKTSNTGNGNSHSHGLNMDIKYINVKMCTKN